MLTDHWKLFLKAAKRHLHYSEGMIEIIGDDEEDWIIWLVATPEKMFWMYTKYWDFEND